MAKMTLIVAIRQRPASWARTSRSTSSLEVTENRSATAWPAPIVLVRRTPLTVRPSSTWDNMSASWRCWRVVTSRRSRATRRVSQIAGGSTTRESSDSRQLSAAIAMAVAATVVTLVAIDVAVLVTTDCMALTSLVSRDWTSPPLVRVKKASDWRCRWEKTSVRRACMTRCPTRVEIQVCSTPKTEVATVTATIPPTTQSQQVQVAGGQRVVDRDAGEERGGESYERGDDQKDHHREDLPAVRGEECGYSGPGNWRLSELSLVGRIEAPWASAGGTVRTVGESGVVCQSNPRSLRAHGWCSAEVVGHS